MNQQHSKSNVPAAPFSRRDFLKLTAAAAAAGPYVITARGADAIRPPASGRIVMGSIGVGNMGSGDLGNFLGFPEVQVVAVADVSREHRERAQARVNERYGNKDCVGYNDFRELLARPDIDAIHVGTPDHWHAVIVTMACRAGKDVYCQKPESLTIHEGRVMVETARRMGRIVSGGSQRVLNDTGEIAQRVWNGELGTPREVHVSCGGPSVECHLPEQGPIPEGFDWDMWLGPAPWAPYHPYRCSGSFAINGTSWRSWRDYSGGGMTDWGAHRFGGAMFAVDMRDQGPVEVLPPDGKDRPYLTFVFANGLKMYHGGGRGGPIEVVGTPGEKLAPRVMPRYKGKSIYEDFLRSVQTRTRPFRDIEFAHRTASLCHLANITYFLNRPLKWDPVKEIFPGDEQANRFLDRAKRAPWTI